MGLMHLKTVGAWMRLSCFLAVASAAATTAALRAARGRSLELAESVGAQLMRFAGAERQDEPRQLVVNGMILHVSSGAAERSVGEVLDHFERTCRRRVSDGFVSAASLAGVSGPAVPAASSPEGRGAAWVPVERQEDAERGLVACLDPMGRELSPAAVLGALERFLETGDLAAVGELRLVFARRGESRTAFLAIWTEGPTALLDAFPATGDAPGRDVPGVPRPPRSRRILSAYEAETDPELAIYESDATAEATAEHYRDAMKALGYALDAERREPETGADFLGFVRDDRVVTVTVQGRGGGSAVSVSALD